MKGGGVGGLVLMRLLRSLCRLQMLLLMLLLVRRWLLMQWNRKRYDVLCIRL